MVISQTAYQKRARRMFLRKAPFLAVIAAALIGLAACGGTSSVPSSSSSTPPAMTTVINANAVPVNNPGEIWTFAPQGFGYFSKEHLNVQQLYNNGGAGSLDEVATGKADFGETSPEDLINAIEAGEPLHPFMTLITSSIYSVGVLASGPIHSYSQLNGKSVGVSSLTSGSDPFAKEALAANGLTGKTSIAVAGNGGPAAAALRSGKVAAMVTTDTQWVTIVDLGVKVRFLPEPAAGHLPADLFYTSDQFFNQHPDLVVRFGAAIMAGIEQAEANPDQAISYYEKEYPSIASSVSSQENLALLKARLQHVQLIPTQGGKWGWIPVSQYDQVQQLGLRFGVIKKKANLSQILSNSLVGKIDQDAAALRRS